MAFGCIIACNEIVIFWRNAILKVPFPTYEFMIVTLDCCLASIVQLGFMIIIMAKFVDNFYAGICLLDNK